MLENFNIYFSFYTFSLKLLDKLEFKTYPGNTIRGALGYTLKKICCIRKTEKECSNCVLRSSCVYVYLFESFPKEILPNYGATKDLPRPFVLEIDHTKKTYQPQEDLKFNLILFGKATDYTPYFIVAFEQLAELGLGKKENRTKFELIEVTNLKGEVVYNNETKILKNSQPLTLDDIFDKSLTNKEIKEITLNFLSPTRIKHNSRLIEKIEFEILFRALLRRIAAIMYFYCNTQPNFDYELLTKKTKLVKIKETQLSWYDWERYSTRQKTKMKLGGLIGKITYQSEQTPLKQFLPFLILGQYTHIGKNCTFGLGRYEVKIGDNK